MQALEDAILRTVLYAEVFHFPLTLPEIHFYLIHTEPISLDEIANILQTSPRLQSTLCTSNGYIVRSENANWIDLRLEREQIAQKLLPKAMLIGRWLAALPFVQMVALTGALAVRNPSNLHDDLDYLLVTRPGRVWLARALAISVVRSARIIGIDICPNYVLAADQLPQQRHDLFMSHEIAQMIPLYGISIYQQMIAENKWSIEYLPNTENTPLYGQVEIMPGRIPSLIKRGLEIVLNGWVGDTLETWELNRKQKRFVRQINTANSSAIVDRGQIKGHFNDHGYHILKAYMEALKLHNIPDISFDEATH